MPEGPDPPELELELVDAGGGLEVVDDAGGAGATAGGAGAGGDAAGAAAAGGAGAGGWVTCGASDVELDDVELEDEEAGGAAAMSRAGLVGTAGTVTAFAMGDGVGSPGNRVMVVSTVVQAISVTVW